MYEESDDPICRAVHLKRISTTRLRKRQCASSSQAREALRVIRERNVDEMIKLAEEKRDLFQKRK